MQSPSIRTYLGAGIVSALALASAASAEAQYRPRPVNDPAIGETFHIEAGAAFWNPSTDIVISSAGSGALSGLAGTDIDAKRDLGFTDQRLPNLQLVLRPAPAHKFRLNYIPIKFEGSTTIQQDIVFNGQRYGRGLPLDSTMEWKALRFGYEYDFIRKNRGFGGFIVEAKYTDVRVDLATRTTPSIVEFAHARAPIPAIGGIARYYVVPNVSATFELTGFRLPDSIDSRYAAHYVDVDLYGTVNFSDSVGVQGGYRTMDLGYLIKQDSGSFVLKGIYFGIVARY